MNASEFLNKRTLHRCVNPRCDRIVEDNILYCCACCEYCHWADSYTEHDGNCNQLHDEREEKMGFHYCLKYKEQSERKAEVPFVIPKGCK